MYKRLTSLEHFAIPPRLQTSSPCLTPGKWSRPLHLRLIHLRRVRVRVGLYLDRRWGRGSWWWSYRTVGWYSRYNIRDLECTLSYDQDLLGRVIQGRTPRWRVHGTFLLSRTNERCPYRILLKLHTFYFWLVSWIITVWTTEDGIECRQILPPSISETKESMSLSAWNNIAIMLGLTVKDKFGMEESRTAAIRLPLTHH